MSGGMRKAPALMGLDMTQANEDLFRGLVRFLRGTDRGATDKTLAAYHHGCLSLQRYLQASGAESDLLSVTRDQVLGWIGELRERGGWSLRAGMIVQSGRPMAKDSLNSYFASARRLLAWAAAEDLVPSSPFAGLKPPRTADKPIPVPPLELVQAMLATCRPRGRKPSWMDLRDEFVIRLFAETGSPRCSEMAELTLERLDMRQDLVTIHGKGGRVRRLPMSPKTATAAQRWLRARAGLRWADLPYAVTGTKGQMTPEGLYDIVDRRSRAAGGHVHPHQLRHFAADAAHADEMTEGDMMALFGWSSNKMVARYGRERREQRAIEASRRHAIGNRL